MSLLEAALVEVAGILDEFHIPYMLIGGMALAQWEAPRATLDIDVTVWVEPERLQKTVEDLCLRLTPKPAAPLAFAGKTRVLPATTSQGVSVDIIFAAWPIERDAIHNAAVRAVAGQTLRVAPLSEMAEALAQPEILQRYHRSVGIP